MKKLRRTPIRSSPGSIRRLGIRIVPSRYPSDRGEVAASSGSCPAIACSTMTASSTVRENTPAVSCVRELGNSPPRLTSPTVGRKPTTEHADAGERMEFTVPVPRATTPKPDATPAADPPLDPPGVRVRS